MFEDTSLGVGMTDLHILSMRVTRLHARVLKLQVFEFLNTRLPFIFYKGASPLNIN